MKKSIESTELSAELPPLTPPSEVVERVKTIIKNAEQPMGRLEVCHEYTRLYVVEVGDNKNLKTHIGFAVTILDRKEEIRKVGEGITGNPLICHYVK
ncbi:MAG: hypothetical protein M1556_07405 [Candidatus Thermoplasmatota archaeon]|jgi:hypothetical protein|nr:hypothetical protein [Candidatus Thermoplasmatota archaeon]